MIKKSITVNVLNNDTQQTKKVILYEGDRNISLYTLIENFKYKFNHNINIEKASATLYNKSTKHNIYVEELEIPDIDTVILPINTEESVPLQIGEYAVVIHLFEGENRVTLPPFFIEIKELI